MSGAWSGWLRRLRKRQAPLPSYWPEAVPAKAAATGPTVEGRKPDARPAGPLPPDPVRAGAGGGETMPPPEPVEAPARSLHALLCAGDLKQARAVLAGETEGDDLTALTLSILEGEEVLRDHAPEADPGDVALPPGIMLASSEGSRTLVVVFGADDGGFAVSQALAGEGHPHLLFVRDPQQCLAMQGVGRLGATYDDCLLAITRLARGVGARNIVCIGGGAATYSALRYGLDLGASGVLALGTLTRLERGSKSPGLRPGRRAAPLLRLTAELGADLDEAFAQAATRPGLVLCRPAGAAVQGLSILPGVVVVEAPRSARNLLDWAESSGRLAEMLGQVLRCRPVG